MTSRIASNEVLAQVTCWWIAGLIWAVVFDIVLEDVLAAGGITGRTLGDSTSSILVDVTLGTLKGGAFLSIVMSFSIVDFS